MNKTLTCFSIIILQLGSSLVFAGGPLIIEGTDGNTPVTYENPDITLHVESGTLGTRDNTEADILVRDAIALWNDINTSSIYLTFSDNAIPDVDINNALTYLPDTYLPDGTELNADDNLNPIVYDDNGEIIEAFLYTGASNDIGGFAASIYNPRAATFSEGYVVINGKNLDLTDKEFMLLIAHEIGHLFGLDHSQANINNQDTYCDLRTLDDYPAMYPFICRDSGTLHLDDVVAISALYPISDTDINNNFGTLQGHFVDESGYAILGANIWAENTVTGDVISIVSDYLKQGNGFYKLYLPAGNYTLHANSINELFNGGSSVGPYAFDLSDKSFVAPHPIPEVTYQEETQGNPAIITIATNQTLNIVFSITGNDAVLVNPPAESSSSSGKISYITLFLLLSFLLLARYTDRLNRYRNKTVSTSRSHCL